MKIHLWAIGKAHDSYVSEGIEVFTKRISKYYTVEWRLLPSAKQTISTNELNVRQQEANIILNTLQNEDYVVLLDERGKQFTSPALALFIEQRAVSRVKQLIFIIGGAFGVDQSVRARANYTWSLSLLVFPHQLVRLMLAEQLYRACTIIKNEKYHHS